MKIYRLLCIILLICLAAPPLSAEDKEEEATLDPSKSGKPIPLTLLPRDRYGLIDWVGAVDNGILEPLHSLNDSEKEEPSFDLVVEIKAKGGFMTNALFPHKAHTYWLKCENCHPKIFPKKKGGTPQMTMWNILKGEYCGRCHDRVAFPLRECYRCHLARKKPQTSVSSLDDQEPKPTFSLPESKPIPVTLLPRDRYGMVDWSEGVRQGILAPLASIDGTGKEEEPIDLLVQIKSKKKFMTDVIFPHAMHTYWLSCKICHPKIFPKKKGGSPKMTMWNILKGEYCGRCHDRVAFPLRECYRCHMEKKKKVITEKPDDRRQTTDDSEEMGKKKYQKGFIPYK